MGVISLEGVGGTGEEGRSWSRKGLEHLQTAVGNPGRVCEQGRDVVDSRILLETGWGVG